MTIKKLKWFNHLITRQRSLGALLILLSSLASGCVASTNRFYNAVEPREIIVLDKRFVPGFTGTDKFLLKVREGDEYRWLKTTSMHYSSMQIGDTLKTVLVYQ